MPTPPASDRITELEARLAELERHQAPAPTRRLARPRVIRRVAAVALALALVIPAGVVLASHRFNDVPTSHQFHAAISAIADAGITTGCPQGTNNYCPNGLVTRGQMAAFLSRLGALQAGSAPKVNADKVDGLQANQLVRAATTTSSASNDNFNTCAMTTLLSKVSDRTGQRDPDGVGHDRGVERRRQCQQCRIGGPGNRRGSYRDREQQSGPAVHGAQARARSPSVARSRSPPGRQAVALQAQECGTGMAFIADKSITTLFVPFGDSGTQGSIAASDLPQVTGSESTENVNGE